MLLVRSGAQYSQVIRTGNLPVSFHKKKYSPSVVQAHAILDIAHSTFAKVKYTPVHSIFYRKQYLLYYRQNEILI